MRRVACLLFLVVVPVGCGGEGETVTVVQTQTVTETQIDTVTETATVTEAAPGLPVAVAATHARILAAAETGDYGALRPWIPSRFSYTFGAPDEGGPIEYWRRVEEGASERPIEILARILRMPYTLANGTYVWPFAYDKRPEELTPYERRILRDASLAESFGEGSGYLGWRAGIEPDGTWRFFIAGD